MSEIMGDPTQQITCPKCGDAIFATIPTARVVNFPDISLVMLMHPMIEVCPACKTPIACGIAKVNESAIELKWVELQVPGKPSVPSVVVPSPQQTLAINKTKGR